MLLDVCERTGLIPARAGNTTKTQTRKEPRWAHPRSRGEHDYSPADPSLALGSSPLARGTRELRGYSHPVTGLIPARAGNTGVVGEDGVFGGAHPRSRGEHCGVKVRRRIMTGSSPLARGTLRQLRYGAEVTGLIPARAGNTNLTISSTSTSRAHPRSRGEHNLRERAYERFLGSSPLARGTPVRVPPAFVGVGLIPARAGNTLTPYTFVVQHAAHPRSRGEHTLPISPLMSVAGSSPLARGTPLSAPAHTPRRGLIPARAGNTLPLVGRVARSRAHPRSRGEHE